HRGAADREPLPPGAPLDASPRRARLPRGNGPERTWPLRQFLRGGILYHDPGQHVGGRSAGGALPGIVRRSPRPRRRGAALFPKPDPSRPPRANAAMTRWTVAGRELRPAPGRYSFPVL